MNPPFRHNGIRTEQAYIDWARRSISSSFTANDIRRIGDAVEVEVFLSPLAVERQVSASTQNQAKAAILYLHRQVLG